MIKYDMDFFTENGFVKTNPYDVGNNGILFRAYLDHLDYKDDKLNIGYMNFVKSPTHENYYYGNYPEHTEHFSIDNMTGLYGERMYYGLDISDLPVFKWNNRIWWHPNGWAVFLSAKYPITKPLFFPILLVMALITTKRDLTSTTGRLLWFLRMNMLGYKNTLKWLNRQGGCFKFAFQYYFEVNHPENINHPIYKQAEIYFKDWK